MRCALLYVQDCICRYESIGVTLYAGGMAMRVLVSACESVTMAVGM